eukprot:m.479532 g.479532  ORF g.479532 m.479532 type:complete len:544 (+) comp21499_c0_seq1:44-1675(+)
MWRCASRLALCSRFPSVSVFACAPAASFPLFPTKATSSFSSLLSRRSLHATTMPPVKTKHYDVLVIGAGSGAKIATPAVRAGLKVAHAEHGFDVFGEHKTGLGGTCLNRGCIPSKMLIHVADVAEEIRNASKFSLHAELNDVDFEELVTRVETEIDKDSNSINPMYEKDRDWYKSSVRFVGPKTLRVADDPELEITADYIFIAGGCVPSVPPIPGLKEIPFLTSTEALRLKKKPKKLIVIGGGYIACELGHYFGGLGVEVHMVVRSELMRTIDPDLKEEFQKVFSSKYNVHDNLHMDKVTFEDGVYTLTYTKDGAEHTVQGDQLLVAAGVRAVTEELDVEKAGIEVKKGGFVKVDDRLRTTAENVWAFGDMAGNYQFRHSANYEAEYLLVSVMQEIFKKQAPPTDYPAIEYIIPWAMFSNPQIAGVGESEESLKERGADYVKGVNPIRKCAMGDAILADHGFVKLLIERGTRKILGCFIVGHEASTLIHQVIPLMRLNAKLEDMLYMVYIHPALNETVRNAARKARDALVAAGDEIPLLLKYK